MAEVTGIHHVALTLSDAAAGAAWFARVFGCTELFAEDGDARRARILRLPGDAGVIGLVEHPGSDDASFDPTRIGLDHLALGVGSRAELDAWAIRLDDAGIEHSGPIDTPVGAILNLKGPDGLALALFADLG